MEQVARRSAVLPIHWHNTARLQPRTVPPQTGKASKHVLRERGWQKLTSINMFASIATLLPVFTVPQPPTMLPLHRQTMSPKVKKPAKKTQLKPQLSTSINEIDE
jgi:hypothetical protein